MSKSECHIGSSHVDFFSFYFPTLLQMLAVLSTPSCRPTLAFKVEATAVVCIYILFLQKYMSFGFDKLIFQTTWVTEIP